MPELSFEAASRNSGNAGSALRGSTARGTGGRPQQAAPRVEGVAIALRPQGFEVTQLTRPPGIFTLIVLNRTGLDQIVLRIDRDTGQNFSRVIAPKEKPDWVDEHQLTPGKYTLREENHPNWVCHITITP